MREKSRKKYGQRKKLDNISWGRSMAATSAVILLIMAASFGVMNYVKHMEEEKSFDRLYEEADDLADEIRMYIKSDRAELELIASMISKYDRFDSEELADMLSSYTAVGMMSRVDLLLPDNRVLIGGEREADAEGVLSFEEEAAGGAHITDRETDILDNDNYIVRHYVPVVKDGVTAAMLYGVIELGELPEETGMDPYGGKGAMYIIDGRTGDFLVDTWHSGGGGNIWELGAREMAPGYAPEEMRQGIIDGESRYVVFVSETTGEYLYFYYEPIGINSWRIAVSVPESVVFESADALEKILNLFLLFELVCFVIYFVWMILYMRRVTTEKQRQLETINYMYDIEKLLFNAHEKKKNINTALEKIGTIVRAEKVRFWLVGEVYGDIPFLWEKEKPGEKREMSTDAEQYHFRQVLRYFEEGNGELEIYDEKVVRDLFGKNESQGIYNVIAVPVEAADGRICGILEGCNITYRSVAMQLLKNTKFSFGMFYANLKKYTEISEQRDRDALTGLYNRNRYERDVPRIYSKYGNSLCCVYIDVNGLHEMNNEEGHDKGDKMLRAVAEGVRECFDTEYAYRTGGDEFIVFIPDADHAEVKERCEELSVWLGEQDYHISVGIEHQKNVKDMPDLIKAAEKKMYEEKKAYYERKENDRRRLARE